jgi:methionyl-tRNA formyltransferase
MLRDFWRIFSSQISKSFGVKKAANFLILVANFAISLWLLSYAMQAIAMSVAYAIWTGMGAVRAVGVGIVFDKEKMSAQKAFYLSLITLSAVMLKII